MGLCGWHTGPSKNSTHVSVSKRPVHSPQLPHPVFLVSRTHEILQWCRVSLYYASYWLYDLLYELRVHSNVHDIPTHTYYFTYVYILLYLHKYTYVLLYLDVTLFIGKCRYILYVLTCIKSTSVPNVCVLIMLTLIYRWRSMCVSVHYFNHDKTSHQLTSQQPTYLLMSRTILYSWLCMCTVDPEVCFCCRVGGTSNLIFIYAIELLPAKNRGRIMSLLPICFMVGQLLIAGRWIMKTVWFDYYHKYLIGNPAISTSSIHNVDKGPLVYYFIFIRLHRNTFFSTSICCPVPL